MQNKIAILYSGGTDSTCAAAIMADKFPQIDLLTYERSGIYFLNNCDRNYNLLRNKFPQVEFKHQIINIEALARYVNGKNYLSNVFRFGFFALSNCLICGLINHFATLLYCLENNIRVAADGSTRDWALFPSHVEEFILELRKMYSRFGIDYVTPVYDFEMFSPVSFTDKLSSMKEKEGVISPDFLSKKTTGNYLFKLGIFPEPNMKGTKADMEMQPRCLQFIVHHIFLHWNFFQRHSYDDFVSIVMKFSKQKIDEFQQLIEKKPQNRPKLIRLIKSV